MRFHYVLIMNLDILAQQLQSLHGRLSNLCQDAIAAQWEANLLPVALKEIATTMEVLEIATDKLFQQTQKLAIAQARVRAEHQEN